MQIVRREKCEKSREKKYCLLMRFIPNSNQLCLPAKGAQDERRQDIADRVHGELCWPAQCGEGNYHGELHSVYCPVLYGVCQP